MDTVRMLSTLHPPHGNGQGEPPQEIAESVGDHPSPVKSKIRVKDVPDFLFTHEDGTQVALEIVGYWTPEYLKEKFAKLARVRAPNLIVAVRKQLALRAGALPTVVLPFSSGILLRDLMSRLEAFRRPPAADTELLRPGSLSVREAEAAQFLRGARGF